VTCGFLASRTQGREKNQEDEVCEEVVDPSVGLNSPTRGRVDDPRAAVWRTYLSCVAWARHDWRGRR